MYVRCQSCGEPCELWDNPQKCPEYPFKAACNACGDYGYWTEIDVRDNEAPCPEAVEFLNSATRHLAEAFGDPEPARCIVQDLFWAAVAHIRTELNDRQK